MQVTPIPTAMVPPVAVPDNVAKTLPQVLGQAAAPLIHRAVDPSSKSDRGNKSRGNQERAKGGGSDKGGRGGSVNIRV